MLSKEQLSLFKRVWVFISIKNKKQFGILLFLTIISAFLDVFSLGAIFPFISVIISPKVIFSYSPLQDFFIFLGFVNPDELILPITILFIILVLLSISFRIFLLYYQSHLSADVASNLSKISFNNTINQPFEFHLNQKSSEVIAGVNKSNGIAGNTIIPAITIINAILLILFIFITLTIINPYISIFTILLVVSFYFFIVYLTNRRVKKYGDITNNNSVKVIQIIQESLGGIRDVLISRNQEFYSDYYFKKNFPILKSLTKVDFISTVPRYLLEGIAIIALIFLLFIQKKIHGDIQIIIPTIAALVVSLQRVLPVTQQLYASLTKLKSNEASLKRVLFYLELKITSKPSFSFEKQLNFKNEIKLSNIFFNYNQYSSYVLSDLSLTIKKGSKIGIVGESGSGKSTLIDIFMGLLRPVKGFIMIDDVQLNNDNLNQWMSKISNVPQTIFLADSTIAENIAFGLPRDKIDMDLVKLVSQKAHISNTIESWENKYDTLVGERGTKLSGGQKQRIGIARALYRKTEVLVLDEATSALDENTEYSVMNELDKFSSEITILIIAHRISTLKGCDKIFEILNGNVLVYNSYLDYVNIKKI